MYHWSLDFMFKAKQNLDSVNQKKNPIWLAGGHLKVLALKINGLLSIATNNMYMKFEIPKQTWVTLQEPCHLILKLKDPICLPGGHFESGITKIYRLLPINTGNVLLNFGSDIKKLPQQTWLTLRKPCCRQMDKLIPVYPVQLRWAGV